MSGGDRTQPGPGGGAGPGHAAPAAPAGDAPPAIELRHINKHFGPVHANRDISLSVARGTIHGIIGENGAGKSTLMKILAGAIQPDSGRILVRGRPVSFSGPIAARDAGIEMIYQDFALVPELTVTQNIFLGRELTGPALGVLRRKAMAERARKLFAELGLRVPSVSASVRELSGGQQQAVAIARATGFDAKLVIMDEPTANLGAPAIAKVRETIARLKAQGVAVIVISHRLEDIFSVGDRFVVMKHGRVVGTRAVSATDNDEIVQMIVSGSDPRGDRTAAE